MTKTRTRRTGRTTELRRMLEERREVVTAQMRERMRIVREGGVERSVRDQDEPVDGDSQSEIVLALLQIQGETIRKIDAALQRLTQRTYGNCSQCSGPIAAERLRALPFAARCKTCEESRERTSGAARSRSIAAFD